ncbi:MAG: response regulator transcription factor [Thermoleophilia bacterium]|nr:response regulator transcription factor [Thermoleophilia bacterium]
MSTSAPASASPDATATDDGRLGLLIADDHDIVREGLRRVIDLHPDMVVLGEAASGEEVLAFARRRRPDVVVMDARMPGMGGLQATRALVQRHPPVRVIVFTAHSEQELLWEALDAGADGFVLKNSDGDTLVGAIRRVVAGDPFVDPRLAPDMLRQLAQPPRTKALSPRERQILQLLADGASNRDVSEELGLSLETVKTNVKHILAKLDAEHRTHAVAIGLRHSLIS